MPLFCVGCSCTAVTDIVAGSVADPSGRWRMCCAAAPEGLRGLSLLRCTPSASVSR
jgi:hypothetical protein